MRALVAVVAGAGMGRLEAEVFGTQDPSVAANTLEAIAMAATGERVAAASWYRSSVAAVAGVVLEDERDVVIRAYQRSMSRQFLEAVVRVQGQLADGSYPCPAPVGDVVVVNGALGRAEWSLSDPGPRRLDTAEMGVSARGFADLVSRAAGLDHRGLEHHPMQLPETDLYPTPHSPLFDFDATAGGAEWIDDIAWAARAAMTRGEAVISHGDWSARNVRLGPSEVQCVYDWESLRYGSESTSVGMAAATWSALGIPHEPLAPSATEIVSYIEQYEVARGRPFPEAERRNARAAAVYTLAYTARCEHALALRIGATRAAGRLRTDPGLRDLLA